MEENFLYGESRFDRDRDYWNNFYATIEGKLNEPSQFADFVSNYLVTGKHLLELGCGNGRDSFFFSELGLKVTGIDASNFIIDKLNRIALHIDNEYVIQGNVEDENSWKKIRTIRNYTKSSDRSYVLGTKVSFSINGTSVKYLGKGWRRPIQNAGGICEKQAVLDFSLLNYNNKDLNLTMWASPVLYEGMTSRNLSVYVNGKKLKTWIIKKRDKYNVLIPR